jgi:hypothetical protein
MDSDIARFVTARLEEDEARAATLLDAARDAIEALKAPRLLGREVPGWHSWADVEAMCSRVLRDVEAKRRILGLHRPNGRLNSEWTRCYGCNDSNGDYEPYPCQAVRLIAATWDGHPDCQPGWKPEATR